MSTDLITYLNYMANWENETDEKIQRVIDEQKLFKDMGDFESDRAVSEEFSTLVSLAKEVRDLSISASAIQIAADAAALAAFWSFGLSMAAFAALEVTEKMLDLVISSESTKLNEKLAEIDIDVAKLIGQKVYQYIDAYKKNNQSIAAQAPKGMDTRHARANLMQFMAKVDSFYKEKDGLTVDNFKQLSRSARIAFNSSTINKVYDALDNLNLSDKSDADVRKFVSKLTEFAPTERQIVQFVQAAAFGVAIKKFRISRKILNKEAKAVGMGDVTTMEAIKAMKAVGKFALGVQIVMSVVDVVLEVYSIVDIVDKYKELVKKLDVIEQKYKDFFNGIKDSANAYNKAIHSKTL